MTAPTLSVSLHDLNEQLDRERAQTALGGGAKRLQALRDKGKMTARERIEYLLDKDTPSVEIGLFAGKDQYTEHGGCPGGGVVVQLGTIAGRKCIVVANDASVKAGAWFPITAKKNLRAQEISMENNLPIIYLVDSAGVYLPLQHEVFADKEHFGRIFRNNAKMSAMGIVQLSAIMGSCVAGGAYLPIMSDEAFIVKNTGSVFLAGSYLVKAAIGETIDNETLGGAYTQTDISGVTDRYFDSDTECLDAIKAYMALMGPTESARFNRAEVKKPKLSDAAFLDAFPVDRTKPYDMGLVLDYLLDEDSFIEYKPTYGKSIVCGYGRLNGWAVAVVANQRKISKNAKGEMQMGGVIYSDSADKAARFIMNSNQRKIPLLFIHDVTGFMVGSRAEHGGIIKDGAKLVNAMANSVVPKITLIVGNSYGAGNYAMCGKAFDPRFIYSWPSAQVAVMGGASATSTLAQIEKSKVNPGTPEEEAEMVARIQKEYAKTSSPYYAASHLWLDGIIKPEETRSVLAQSLEAVNCQPLIGEFKLGVLQT